MTDDDFRLIEKNLGIQLPEDYKAVFRHYPERGLPVFDELLNDYYAVLQSNTLARQYARICGDDLEEVRWPANYFVIGNDAFGNAYFLDLAQPPYPVFFWEHESSEVQEVCAAIQQFVPYLLQLHNRDRPTTT